MYYKSISLNLYPICGLGSEPSLHVLWFNHPFWISIIWPQTQINRLSVSMLKSAVVLSPPEMCQAMMSGQLWFPFSPSRLLPSRTDAFFDNRTINMHIVLLLLILNEHIWRLYYSASALHEELAIGYSATSGTFTPCFSFKIYLLHSCWSFLDTHP